jgi:hypothetical protein
LSCAKRRSKEGEATSTMSDTATSNDNTDKDKTDNHEEDLPCAKKLRYMDPDVEIIVRCHDENGTIEEKKYSMYSAVLASLSKFIDTSLSVDMCEKRTGIIVFQDVSPATFEAAIGFLRDPVAGRTMTPRNVLQMVGFYDRYEFEGGLQLCNQILQDYFTPEDPTIKNTVHPALQDLDLFVNAVTVADRFALQGAQERGIACLDSILQKPCHSRFGPIVFLTQHIATLQPLFEKGCFNDILQQMQITPGSPEVQSPLFPRFFVGWTATSCLAYNLFKNTLMTFCLDDGNVRLKAIGTRYEAKMTKDYEQVVYIIKKSAIRNGDWIIKYKNLSRHPGSSTAYWYSPCSHNLPYPPQGPWLPIHMQALDSPAIFYGTADDE